VTSGHWQTLNSLNCNGIKKKNHLMYKGFVKNIQRHQRGFLLMGVTVYGNLAPIDILDTTLSVLNLLLLLPGQKRRCSSREARQKTSNEN
jgi:hypothetical protein